MSQFKPGQSGNPGGRPKGYGDLREKAREHTEDALKVLVTVMNDEKAPASARQAAADAVLNRGWGRPESTVNLTERSESWTEMIQRIQNKDAQELRADCNQAAH